MTQLQLGERTGFSESQIGRYETGETTIEPATPRIFDSPVTNSTDASQCLAASARWSRW